MKNQRKRDPELLQRVSQSLDEPVRADPELVASSIHEAGHAVACKLLFGEMLATQITNSGIFESAIWVRPRGNSPDALRQSMIVLMAGPMAKRRHCPAGDDGGVDDRAQAKDIARRLYGILGSQKKVDAELFKAERAAKKLVNKHWQDILKISELLLQFHKALSSLKNE
jgi:hypothetical protein